MKKTLLKLTFLAALAAGTANAQKDGKFFEQVNFRGAMGTEDWTAGWANMRPDLLVYPGEPNGASKTVVNLNPSDNVAYIQTNTTWTSDKVYFMSNRVIVKSGVTLTIEPGTVIRGSKLGVTRAGMLIVARGAKLIAEGTSTNPIIFTSAKAKGERNIGDWGGVLILGKAIQADNGDERSPVKEGTVDGVDYFSSVYETFSPTDPDAADLRFGGIDNNDNSGSLKYVRIEFGGWYQTLGKEINGLTLAGVGKGTTLDFIECIFINDDSFEWYGGCVNAKHLISIGANDDDFDTDLGATPKLQFCFSVRHPLFCESGGGSRGIEADGNSDFGYAKEVDPMPKSTPIFANMTLVGPIYPGANKANFRLSAKFDFGVIIRTNSEAKLFNSVVTNFPSGSIRLRHALVGATPPTPSCYDKALADKIAVESNVFFFFFGIIGNADNILFNVKFPVGSGTTFNTRTWIFRNNNAAKIDTLYKNSLDLKLTNLVLDTNILTPSATVLVNDPISVKPLANSPLLTDANLAANWDNALLKNDSYTAVTGITSEYFDKGEIVVFPNPSEGKSTIKLAMQESAEVEISVYDITGKSVFSKALSTEVGNTFVELNLNTGFYIVRVSEGKNTANIKLIVKNL